MYSQCINTLGFCWPEEEQIHNGATVHVAYPKLTIPCLLMLWRLYEPEHHQTLYWSWSSKFPSPAPKELNYWHWLNAKCNINLGHDSHELLTWHAMHSALSRFYKTRSGLLIWYGEKKNVVRLQTIFSYIFHYTRMLPWIELLWEDNRYFYHVFFIFSRCGVLGVVKHPTKNCWTSIFVAKMISASHKSR